MIGYSIMMWFVAVILFFVSVSLLRGNIASMHGKTFDNASDKIGYAKALGKPVLVMCFGIIISGIIALLGPSNGEAIRNAIIELLIVVVIVAIWFVAVQRRYKEN